MKPTKKELKKKKKYHESKVDYYEKELKKIKESENKIGFKFY